MRSQTTGSQPTRVLERAKHDGERLDPRTEPVAGTARLSTAPEPGVKGGMSHTSFAEQRWCGLRTAHAQVRQSSLRKNHRLESRMRETRLSGSEGGGTELNRSFLPLSEFHRSGHRSQTSSSFNRSSSHPESGRSVHKIGPRNNRDPRSNRTEEVSLHSLRSRGGRG